jgi:hypothetical protein
MYVHGSARLRIPIRHVDKASLPLGILQQLHGDSGPDSKYWPIVLLVMVVKNGTTVLSFGNIADSADLRSHVYPAAVMFPPAHPAISDPSLHTAGEYQRFFTGSWNLEYFVAVALQERPPRAATSFLDMNSAGAVPLSRSNVILWGGAETPLKNSLFISHRIREIRALLEAHMPDVNPRFITLYGAGPKSTANDTSITDGNRVTFRHGDIETDFSASRIDVSTVFAAVRHSENTRTLLIHVGHSGENGIPLWGQLGVVSPDDVSNSFQHGSNRTIMISGGCHSGVFARSAQCGFFAAHPEVLATGCQLSPEAVDESDDYLRLFFASLQEANHRDADSNADGKITLEESHWYSSVRIEDHQVSYSTIDALADEYFAADPSRLPVTMSVAEAIGLGESADPAELQALRQLTAKLPSGLKLALTTIVEKNHEAQVLLEHVPEAASADRNALLALDYKLMLPMLVRRLLYERANAGNTQLQSVQSCEKQSAREFLEGH